MPLFETESLVLKTYNLAEADRIVVFLTREHGLVRGVAKGAKRLKSKFGSTLEPFSTVQLTYFQKEDRDLVSVQQVELLRSSFEVASDPSFLHTYSYIADLLLSFVPQGDPNETLYRMVKACIVSGGSRAEELASIRFYFEVWLLRLGGYIPDWSRCNICKRTFSPDESASVMPDFQLACSECRKASVGTHLNGTHRDLFFQAQRLAPDEFKIAATGHADAVTETSDVLKRIIATVIGREV